MPAKLSEQMKEYLLWLNENAGRRINIEFFGGEPLLFFDRIKEIYEFFHSMSNCIYTFSLTTNGKLMDEEKLEWLNARFFSICYSYDGPRSEEIRGYDVWKEKKDMILNTNDVYLSSVLTSKSYIYDVCSSLQKIQKEYRAKNGYDINVSMTDVMENINGHRDKSLTVIDIEEMKRQYRDLLSYYIKYESITNKEQAENFYNEYNIIINRARGIVQGKVVNTIEDGFRLTHFCGEFFYNISIDLDGNVYDCLFSSEPILHVNDNSEKVLRTMMENEYPLMKRKDTLCRNCYAWPLCDGGCKNNLEPEALKKWCQVQQAIMDVVIEIADKK